MMIHLFSILQKLLIMINSAGVVYKPYKEKMSYRDNKEEEVDTEVENGEGIASTNTKYMPKDLMERSYTSKSNSFDFAHDSNLMKDSNSKDKEVEGDIFMLPTDKKKMNATDA